MTTMYTVSLLLYINQPLTTFRKKVFEVLNGAILKVKLMGSYKKLVKY